jgi:hypothetical protein
LRKTVGGGRVITTNRLRFALRDIVPNFRKRVARQRTGAAGRQADLMQLFDLAQGNYRR